MSVSEGSFRLNLTKLMYFFHKFEELTFRSPRVAEEKHVNIAAQAHAVREYLLGAAEQETCDGFFDV